MPETFHDPKAVAARYGVGVPVVLGWIHRSELKAINVSKLPTSKRPRWKISTSALVEFEGIRTATTQTLPVPRRRQKAKRDSGWVSYYGS